MRKPTHGLQDEELKKADVKNKALINKHLKDERHWLYSLYLKIIHDVKPAAFVYENVPGILSLDKGRVITHIVDEFRSCGYHVEYKLHHAADFGTPQSRKRVFIVGTRSDVSKSFDYWLLFNPTNRPKVSN